jgi:poly-beta-1,6-N-acetyl-D-glucosamine synthase
MKTDPSLSYVLITPARNEEAFIEETIRSMIAQTARPLRWVIVSDGSTDRTDEIASSYLPMQPWIDFVRMPPHEDRQFASKVHSFRAGYRRVEDLRFDVVGNLDADLSFGPDHFEYLLEKFGQDPDLGVAGTPFVEDEGTLYDYRFTNIEHVSGACQLFRRTCFESIGGYLPIKKGGVDRTAVTLARMKGWRTRTFTDRFVHHHRKMGTGKRNRLGARFTHGQQDYYLGNHPLWEVFRMFYQLGQKPRVAGGFALFLGYLKAAVQKQDRPVPDELVAFVRREQMDRLREKVRLPRKKPGRSGS